MVAGGSQHPCLSDRVLVCVSRRLNRQERIGGHCEGWGVGGGEGGMWGGRGSFKARSVHTSHHVGREGSSLWRRQHSGLVRTHIRSGNVTCLLFQRSTSIFCKGSHSKYFRPVAHLVSVTTTQICCHRIKAAVDAPDVSGRGCHSVEPHSRKQAGWWIWPVGSRLLTSAAFCSLPSMTEAISLTPPALFS